MGTRSWWQPRACARRRPRGRPRGRRGPEPDWYRRPVLV